MSAPAIPRDCSVAHVAHIPNSLCRACPIRTQRAPNNVTFSKRSNRAETAVIAEIEVGIGRAGVLTVELVPLRDRTDVRLSMSRRRSDGTVKQTPLRVTFSADAIDRVIAGLQSAARIVSSAVPVPEPGESP